MDPHFTAVNVRHPGQLCCLLSIAFPFAARIHAKTQGTVYAHGVVTSPSDEILSSAHVTTRNSTASAKLVLFSNAGGLLQLLRSDPMRAGLERIAPARIEVRRSARKMKSSGSAEDKFVKAIGVNLYLEPTTPGCPDEPNFGFRGAEVRR